jgi:hypothetical protein
MSSSTRSAPTTKAAVQPVLDGKEPRSESTDALKAAPHRDLTGFPDERTPQPPGHRRQDRGLDDESEHPRPAKRAWDRPEPHPNRHDELTATPVTFWIKPEEGLQAT